MDHHTDQDQPTNSAEDDAVAHVADRPPTDDEAAAADEHWATTDPDRREDVAEHEREMMDIGARSKGEGRIS